MKNMILSAVFILILPVFISLYCYAGMENIRGVIKSEEIFKNANSLYKQNQYSQAAEEYEQVISKGYESGNLYYNLGNSYFKTGDLGRAILNYERARLFIPYDSDLNANYNYTKSLLNLGAQPFSAGWLFRYPDKISQAVGINFLAVSVCGFYVLICLFWILRMFFNGAVKFYKIAVVFFALLFILGSVCLYRKIYYLNTAAVVVIKQAQVKFEPFETATRFFTLEQGSRAEVIERSGDWRKLRRSDGKAGWVNKPAIEFIRNF